jgi:hypothetical protein
MKKKAGSLIEVVRFSAKIIFHFLIFFIKIFRMPTEGITQAFIKLNNLLVKKERYILNNNELLLLLPRCLQKRDCKADIADDIKNCQRCGLCPVAGMVDIVERYQIPTFVVDGGELARRKVRDVHPQAIVAVACERELEEGILDVLPPVIGIANERPNGPCRETKVSKKEVEEAIRFFLGSWCKEPIFKPFP